MTHEFYASVLRLDRAAVRALRITDVYSLHRVAYSLFEDVRDSEQKSAHVPSGILWADKGGDAFERRVLMLSDRLPAQHAQEQYGVVETKVIAPSFMDYSRYRFSVVVNPTRRDSASRKLIPVKGRDAVAQWFSDRAPDSWGFSVDKNTLDVGAVDVIQFSDKNQRSVTLMQAHVDGMLTVTDREHFKQSFTQGIGRGRAFGCGLLQIVPVIENPFF